MHTEDHEIDRHDAWMYQSTSQQAGAPDKARFYYDDNNNIDEKKTYSKRYYEQLHPKTEEKKAEKENKGKKQNSSSDEGGSGYCVKFLCTIILVLPIWWCIKCIIALGAGFFKAVYYVISWPFRLMFCCCCDTAFIPDDVIKWPKYDF